MTDAGGVQNGLAYTQGDCYVVKLSALGLELTRRFEGSTESARPLGTRYSAHVGVSSPGPTPAPRFIIPMTRPQASDSGP